MCTGAVYGEKDILHQRKPYGNFRKPFGRPFNLYTQV